MTKTGCVKTNGFEMEYFTFGSGSRPFVILPGISIQGVMGVQRAVEESYAIMKEDFTVYVFDRRKEVPDPYSIDDMADDTAAVLAELALTDVYLFGASQGGMIAMVLAARYPALVKKLILGSTASRVSQAQFQTTLSRWINLAKEKNAAALYDAFGRAIYPADIYAQFKDIFAAAAKTVTEEELKKFIILAESVCDFDCTEELVKITCPVLAIGNKDDEVLDAAATEEIMNNLSPNPDHTMYLYEGYGHAAFDTAPDYRQRLYDFCIRNS